MQIEPVHNDTISYLTPRQRKVIACIAQGMSNGDIASALFISLSTVEREVRRACKTLRVANRAELAAIAAVRGLIAVRRSS
ncbi:helix-turn-helix transcriptional regulator [Glycomyces sp. NPDC049804]|uniref:response regulator transcription factor n=1 Tax=Glycomyces sp. NPDC049804 TaxID=3154363 RepID=UPI0034222B5F